MKAFSVNKYYGRDQRYKTAAAKQYESAVLSRLLKHNQLLEMAKIHRQTGGCFHISIDCKYPKKDFYNEQGKISAKTFDCSNIEKPLLDLILGRFMEVNDKNVVKLVSTKSAAGASHTIDITLELVPYADSKVAI